MLEGKGPVSSVSSLGSSGTRTGARRPCAPRMISLGFGHGTARREILLAVRASMVTAGTTFTIRASSKWLLVAGRGCHERASKHVGSTGLSARPGEGRDRGGDRQTEAAF